MKYAIVIPTLTVGGAEKIALETAIGIYKKGHKVSIIVLSASIDLNVPDYIKVVQIKKNKLYNLISYLKDNKFDGCISYMERANLLCALACKVTKTNFCASVHTAPKAGFAQRKLINKIAISLTYRLLRLLNSKVICVCNGIKNDLQQLYKIKNSIVIPNFINQDEIAKKASVNIKTREKYDFLFVGRLSKVKGCDILIDAIIANKTLYTENNISTIIIGDGPERNNLENRIINANLSQYVQFLGTIDNPYSYMQDSKFLVVPSYAEGFGLVILEGLSLGCNIIYSECDFGPKEIITNYFPEMQSLSISDPGKNRDIAVEQMKMIINKVIVDGYSNPVSFNEVQSRINIYYNRSLVCDKIIQSFN
ncbi:glycosyltransferase [Dryocola sp. BD586]|uniref:glycosyltransferase n=1 Tax=Dryocola sp. BD586 TaxID=3133271 RepID=UPI003F50182B